MSNKAETPPRRVGTLDEPDAAPARGATGDEHTASWGDHDRRRPWWLHPRLIVAAVGAFVLAAIAIDTTYRSPGDDSLAAVETFDAQAYGQDTYPKVVAEIESNATDLGELITALEADEAAASEEFGHQPGTGPYSFPVRATGIAGTPENGNLPLEVEGIPDDHTVQVQVGPVIRGTALRDSVAIIDFNQFLNQMDYAAAARTLNDQVKEQVLAAADGEELAGREISVVGAFTRTPGTTITITPIALEVAS